MELELGLPPVWPPASYKRLRYLMDHGKGQRAIGPCAVPKCRFKRYAPDTPLSPFYVWDHCHLHDYVRGMLCRTHNGLMSWLDARIAGHQASSDANLMEHWLRCPQCAAGGWEPWLTRQEADMRNVQRVLRTLPSWWDEPGRDDTLGWLEGVIRISGKRPPESRRKRPGGEAGTLG